ncbi:membrane protease YdiL (CAAX protease family) [Lipingzhangella halophila]|uniref:Membrane protease YdiL (CAAX protease family) n=1 Tax=Lipingzhangella halophila TaxID=1783352 RepID=A0A7W7RLQ1_9ACTN|nr:CPBP family intramembrane glutamic endopeptidase [Lipingzhangella halophila]MBB4934281.1 membrane protease YdiL (CAAX protease family) [Lipingzhangella halophila]
MQPTARKKHPAAFRDRGALPFREIASFVALAFGLAWLVHTPALLGGVGPEDPLYGISAQVYMFTPGLAALVVGFAVWRRPSRVARGLALTLRPFRRVGGYCLLALLVFTLLGVVAPLVAAALGVIQLDLTGFSGLRAAIEERAPGATEHLTESGFPLRAYLVAVGTFLVTAVPMSLLTSFGEEVGWRGYLLPRLLPLGVWPALLVTGLIHGLWHSPQLFIQARSGGMGADSITVFLVFIVVAGILFGWLRLASGSVWPAVVAHGVNNSVTALGFLTLSAADTPTHPVLYSGGAGGVVGMVLILILVCALALSGQLRVRSSDPSTGQ